MHHRIHALLALALLMGVPDAHADPVPLNVIEFDYVVHPAAQAATTKETVSRIRGMARQASKSCRAWTEDLDTYCPVEIGVGNIRLDLMEEASVDENGFVPGIPVPPFDDTVLLVAGLEDAGNASFATGSIWLLAGTNFADRRGKTLVHETGHLVGLQHCLSGVMAGSDGVLPCNQHDQYPANVSPRSLEQWQCNAYIAAAAPDGDAECLVRMGGVRAVPRFTACNSGRG